MRTAYRALGLAVVVLVGAACGGWEEASISSYRLEGDRRLVVNGHCNDDGRVRVTEEDTDMVVLKMEVEGSRRGDCLECPTIELDEPLGDRTLIEAHGGDLIPLDPETC